MWLPTGTLRGADSMAGVGVGVPTRPLSLLLVEGDRATLGWWRKLIGDLDLRVEPEQSRDELDQIGA